MPYMRYKKHTATSSECLVIGGKYSTYIITRFEVLLVLEMLLRCSLSPLIVLLEVLLIYPGPEM